MGCKSKYRDNEAFGLQEGCSSASQGRALESAGDRRPREMTVAPQGEQNPAYSPGSQFRRFRVGPLFVDMLRIEILRKSVSKSFKISVLLRFFCGFLIDFLRSNPVDLKIAVSLQPLWLRECRANRQQCPLL